VRNLTEYERMFLGGLAGYPELIYCFDDLDINHFVSKYGFLIYDGLRKAEFDEIKKHGIYGIIIKIKQKKLINQKEFEFALNNYDLLDIHLTTNNIELSYQKIKDERNKFSLISKINNINIQNLEITEIIKILTETITKYDNMGSDTYFPTSLSDIDKTKNMIKPCGVITGLSSIDNIVKFEKNTFCVIAARPFQGKTTFACKIAMENTYKKKVLFFSAEMTKHQLAYKMRYYGMNYKRENLLIVYSPKLDFLLIARTIKKVSPDVIIIDQLNKIKDLGKTEYERFSNVSVKLKVLAGEIEVPIICLAQINRSAENKRPYLYNIKGSGGVEEESDVVMILHIEDERRENNLTTIHIDKNRTFNNKIGYEDLRFYPDTNFYEVK